MGGTLALGVLAVIFWIERDCVYCVYSEYGVYCVHCVFFVSSVYPPLGGLLFLAGNPYDILCIHYHHFWSL